MIVGDAYGAVVEAAHRGEPALGIVERDDGFVMTDRFDYLFVGPDELSDLAEGTGWRLATTIADDEPIYVAILEKA